MDPTSQKIILDSPPSRKGTRFSSLLKRFLDIVISLLVFIFLWPFFCLISFAIWRDSPGPVFYRGPRMGKGGRIFLMIKFRTMYEIPESYRGPKVTAHDDPRITRLGHWLRNTKLNELPQFWNVLVGEMSLVGPRPEDPEIARSWPAEIWAEILSVRPGITSPASIQYHDEERLLSAGSVMQIYLQDLVPDKTRLDQLYVRYRSFWLDLDIILWTALILLPRVSSYTLPEEILFLGPVTRLISRYVNWFLTDSVIAFMIFSITSLIWRTYDTLDAGVYKGLAWSVGFALLFNLIGVIFKTNRIAWTKATTGNVFALFPPWFLSTGVAFMIHLWVRELEFPSGFILIASMCNLGGFVITRYRQHILSDLMGEINRYSHTVKASRERVLIIGLGAAAQHAAWLLDHLMNSRDFWVVGFVDNDMFRQGMRLYGSSVVGMWKDIPKLVKKYDVGMIILADYRVDPKTYHVISGICDKTPARLIVLPDILAVLYGLVETSPLEPHLKIWGQEISDSPCPRCLVNYPSPNIALKRNELQAEAEAPNQRINS